MDILRQEIKEDDHRIQRMLLKWCIKKSRGCFWLCIKYMEARYRLFQFAFSSSPLIAQFERGNPSVVSGRSGIELVSDIIYGIDKKS